MKTTVETRWRELGHGVEGLTASKRLGFATFVASRAARYYLEYCQSHVCSQPQLTSNLLELAWRAVEFGASEEDFKALRNRLEAVAAEFEASSDTLGTAAQEACFACMVLCEMLAGENDAKQPVRIVNFLRDITDLVVQDRAGIDGSAEQLEADILAHPLMADELARVGEALRVASREPKEAELVALLKSLV